MASQGNGKQVITQDSLEEHSHMHQTKRAIFSMYDSISNMNLKTRSGRNKQSLENYKRSLGSNSINSALKQNFKKVQDLSIDEK